MKLYQRQIKPFIQPLALQGCNNTPYEVDGFDCCENYVSPIFEKSNFEIKEIEIIE